MISEKQLKDYARKIYEQEDGYTIEKAYRLFFRYAPKIQVYLNDYLLQDEQQRIQRLLFSNDKFYILFYQKSIQQLAQLRQQYIQANSIVSSAVESTNMSSFISAALAQHRLTIQIMKLSIQSTYIEMAEESYLGTSTSATKQEYQQQIQFCQEQIRKAEQAIDKILTLKELL